MASISSRCCSALEIEEQFMSIVGGCGVCTAGTVLPVLVVRVLVEDDKVVVTDDAAADGGADGNGDGSAAFLARVL